MRYSIQECASRVLVVVANASLVVATRTTNWLIIQKIQIFYQKISIFLNAAATTTDSIHCYANSVQNLALLSALTGHFVSLVAPIAVNATMDPEHLTTLLLTNFQTLPRSLILETDQSLFLMAMTLKSSVKSACVAKWWIFFSQRKTAP